MKFLKVLIITWAMTAQAGLPPTTLNGVTTFNFINDELLKNADLEVSNLVGSWACTTGTASSTSVAGEVGKGARALKITSGSPTALRCYQEVATLAGSPVQHYVRGFYKFLLADLPDFRICTLINGNLLANEQTCIPTANLIGDNTYRQFEIPVTVTPGQNVGVVFKTTATSTAKSAYIDTMSLKQGLGTQNLSNDTDSIAFTPTGSWSTNTTYTGAYWRHGDKASGWVKVSTSGAPTATALTVNLPSGLVLDTAKIPAALVVTTGSFGYGQAFDSGVAVFDLSVGYWSSTSLSVMIKDRPATYVQNGSQLTHAFPFAFGANDVVFVYFQDLPIVGWSASSGVYAQSALNIKRAGSITPIAGTVCGAGNLLANGAAISRTTYSELFAEIGVTHGNGDGALTFNLPDYRGRFLRGVAGGSTNDPDRASRTAMGTGGNTGDNVGSVQGDQFGSHAHGVNVWFGENGTGPKQPNIQGYGDSGPYAAGTTVATGGTETRAKNAYVNYCISTTANNVIVGSFDGIEKCNAATNECDDTFSATIDASDNVSQENVDFINGNCTSGIAGRAICNFKSGIFTVAPNCSVTASDSSNASQISCSIAGTATIAGLTVDCKSDAADSNRPFVLMCQKQGVDYKPKTAKVGVPFTEVSALYTGAPPTGTLAASFNTTTFGTKVKDTHNAYKTTTGGGFTAGDYVVPVSGVYSIASQVYYSATFISGQQVDLAIHVDGVAIHRRTNDMFASASASIVSLSVLSVPLLAGQIVTMRTFINGTTPTYVSSAVHNFFSVTRTGEY
jgi:microcystin-dependent protein